MIWGGDVCVRQWHLCVKQRCVCGVGVCVCVTEMCVCHRGVCHRDLCVVCVCMCHKDVCVVCVCHSDECVCLCMCLCHCGIDVCNNDNNENLSSTSFENEPKALHNGNLQCTVLITRYTNRQDTRDKYKLNMRTHTPCTDTHTSLQKCHPPPLIGMGGGGELHILLMETFSVVCVLQWHGWNWSFWRPESCFCFVF